MTQIPLRRIDAVLSLWGAMLAFAVIPIFLQYFAKSNLDAWTVNGIRYSIGAVFWLPFLLFLDRRNGSAPPEPAARGVWRDAAVPAIVNILGQAGFGLGAYFVSASTMGFVLRLSFLCTIFLGFLILPEERRLAARSSFWIGTLLSVVGVVAMFAEELRTGGETGATGMVILLLTAVAWGAYAVCVRRYMAPYSARQSFSVISIYTSVGLSGLMFAFGNFQDAARLSAGLWMLLMISALIGIAFGHVLYYRGLHRLGPIAASGILLITPFGTHLLAAIFLGERLAGLGWLGGFLVVAGGCLLVAARWQTDRPSAAPTAEDLDDQAGG
jgi:drug/metabolite transporter (DMT)-like permease